METTILLKAGVMVLAVLAATVVSIWARKHPNRVRKHPRAVRMPKFVAFVGWLILVVGLIMCLAAFATDGGTDPTAMRIASVAMVLGGLFFVVIYRNFWFFADKEGVKFRTIWGRTKEIRYDEIVKYRIYSQQGAPIVSLHAADGRKFSANARTYDVTPILQAITFYEREGYWPSEWHWSKPTWPAQ